jgi:nucleotide-binding universal stress UspA family protein
LVAAPSNCELMDRAGRELTQAARAATVNNIITASLVTVALSQPRSHARHALRFYQRGSQRQSPPRRIRHQEDTYSASAQPASTVRAHVGERESGAANGMRSTGQHQSMHSMPAAHAANVEAARPQRRLGRLAVPVRHHTMSRVALKDLLVYVDPSEHAAARLRLAVDLARRHGSHITALYVRERSAAEEALERRKTAELARRSFDELRRLDAGSAAADDSVEQQLSARLKRMAGRFGLEVEWRPIVGEPSIVLPQHSRYADLCIFGEDIPNESTSIGYSFTEEMLFVTGRPIVLIPAAGSFKTLGRHLLIAWNSSRAAARSVNDALPLIERCEQLTVLAVNPTHMVDTYSALPAQRLVEHLQRHGAAPKVVTAEGVAPATIAAVIAAKALEVGADLIVAGAYGHARLREKLLGGVTRDLLAAMKMPLLMSH